MVCVGICLCLDLEDDSCKLLEVKTLLSRVSLPIKSDKLLNVSEPIVACH